MLSPIILASASPRRKELLANIVQNFTAVAADIDETPYANEMPQALVERLALSKARCIYQHHTSAMVIGSDTVVAIGDEILGKPTSFADFTKMMLSLSNQVHKVYTGVAILYKTRRKVITVVTEVSMTTISSAEIRTYWDSGEPQDKAGGYAIQGIGGQFVTSINGSVSAVVGLPLAQTKQLILTISE